MVSQAQAVTTEDREQVFNNCSPQTQEASDSEYSLFGQQQQSAEITLDLNTFSSNADSNGRKSEEFDLESNVESLFEGQLDF